MVVQGAQHLQPGQHAVDPVVVAAQRLRVHVRAGYHRGEGSVPARAADKHIAHAVNIAGKTRLQRPVAQQVAGNPVFVA
ncbi:hypothetical protein D3C76_1685480 [compost metagenome]